MRCSLWFFLINITCFFILLGRGKDSEGQEVTRPYTPITLDSQAGYFELVVKVNIPSIQIFIYIYIYKHRALRDLNRDLMFSPSRCIQKEGCHTITGRCVKGTI